MARIAIAAAVLVALLGAACGKGYPSRDWSGNYLTRMIASSSDCAETPLPPPLPAFSLHVEQQPDNRATVRMNPIITLRGSFEGDRLAARGVLVEAVELPDTLRRRLSPADSFDAIAYHLEAGFEKQGFRARYEIRTPDVRALAEGAEDLRCSYRYELAGARFEPTPLAEQPGLAPATREGAEGGAEPPAGDTTAAPSESL